MSGQVEIHSQSNIIEGEFHEKIFYHWVTFDSIYLWKGLDSTWITAHKLDGLWKITPKNVEEDSSWLLLLRVFSSGDTAKDKLLIHFLELLEKGRIDTNLSKVRYPDIEVYLVIESSEKINVVINQRKRIFSTTFNKINGFWKSTDSTSILRSLNLQKDTSYQNIIMFFGLGGNIPSSSLDEEKLTNLWIENVLKNKNNFYSLMFRDNKNQWNWVWFEKLNQEKYAFLLKRRQARDFTMVEKLVDKKTGIYWWWLIPAFVIGIFIGGFLMPKIKSKLKKSNEIEQDSEKDTKLMIYYNFYHALYLLREKNEVELLLGKNEDFVQWFERITNILSEHTKIEKISNRTIIESMALKELIPISKKLDHLFKDLKSQLDHDLKRNNKRREFELLPKDKESLKEWAERFIDSFNEIEKKYGELDIKKKTIEKSEENIIIGENLKSFYDELITESSAINEKHKFALRPNNKELFRDWVTRIIDSFSDIESKYKDLQTSNSNNKALEQRVNDLISNSNNIRQENERLASLRENFEFISKIARSLSEGISNFCLYHRKQEDMYSPTILYTLVNYSITNLFSSFVDGEELKQKIMLANLFNISMKFPKIGAFDKAKNIILSKYRNIDSSANEFSISSEIHPEDQFFQQVINLMRNSSGLNLAPFYFNIDKNGKIHRAN